MNNTRTLSSTSVSSRSLSGQSWTGSSVVASFAIALVVIFSTTLLSTAAFASSTPQGTFDKTLTVSGPVDLEALTHSGDITIRTGASAAVIIHGKIFVSDHWLRGNRQSDVDQIVQNPPMRQSVGNSAAAFESGISFRRLGGEPASPGDQRFGFRLLQTLRGIGGDEEGRLGPLAGPAVATVVEVVVEPGHRPPAAILVERPELPVRRAEARGAVESEVGEFRHPQHLG